MILLSENKLMEVEEEALTSLSTLDIVSIIIVSSIVISTIPVLFPEFFLLRSRFGETSVWFPLINVAFQNWGRISAILDPIFKNIPGHP